MSRAYNDQKVSWCRLLSAQGGEVSLGRLMSFMRPWFIKTHLKLNPGKRGKRCFQYARLIFARQLGRDMFEAPNELQSVWVSLPRRQFRRGLPFEGGRRCEG